MGYWCQKMCQSTKQSRNWKFEFVAKTQSIPFQKYFSKTDLTSFQIYSIFFWDRERYFIVKNFFYLKPI